jgi:molybdenum cofactor cytidylyltransferase
VTPASPAFAAIVLAGGASSRMGAPKPLLTYEGETFLDRLTRLFAVHCAPVVAVVGHHAEAIAQGLAHPERALLVLNPRPERGQLSSLQCGLRALAAAPCPVFFHPVDIPALAPATLARLCAAWHEAPPDTLILQPAFEGRTGHPVLIAPAIAAELLALDPGDSARTVLRRHAARAVIVPVNDPAILRDADTPDDYRRLAQEHPAP